jgi:chemotaxis protein CheX
MNVQYINPFVAGAFSVLEMVLGNKPTKGELRMQPNTFTSQQCNVVCGVTGHVQGHVIYGMSLTTADRIASTMLGEPIKVFDQLAASAIGELGNMISGNAMQMLSETGWICDITPPTIIRGQNVNICTITIPAIIIPITLDQGELCVTIGLQGRK